MSQNDQPEIISLIPAGGQATRISPLPSSKEIFPIGFQQLADGRLRPKAVCNYLLEKMRLAGAKKSYIVLRKGKWDIPAYLEDGAMLDMDIAYLIMRLPYGAPYTLDQAYPFAKDAMIVFGFPDILFEPEDAFVQLLNRQTETGAEVVLGLFEATNPQKADMVAFDDSGRVTDIVVKPPQTNLTHTWMMAVWTPRFTDFMHNYLQVAIDKMNSDVQDDSLSPPEVYVGHVIQAAIDEGMHVDQVVFQQGKYIDIGTPDDMIRAISDGIKSIG
ncbi:MAG: sugar phosphate nucleotidyltransferase [Chloroflexota bacterium]